MGKLEKEVKVLNVNKTELEKTLEKINANIGEEDHGGYGFKLIKQKFNG